MTRIATKTLWRIVLIGFVAALVVFFAVATSGFRNWNGNEWFNYWGKGKPAATVPVTDPEDVPNAVEQSAMQSNNNRSNDTSTGRMLIKTQSQNASAWNPGCLTLHGKSLFDSAPSSYDDFEYILGIDLYTTHSPVTDFYFSLSCSDSSDPFLFSLTTSNSGRTLRIGRRDSGALPVYSVDKTWNIFLRDYALFVTFSNNRFFVSCVPSGEGLPTYENSLDFIIWDSADPENENLFSMNVVKSVVLGTNLYYNYTVTPSDYSKESIASIVTETVNFYKVMEIPEKEGYTFTGWYYDEACTRPYKGEPITDDTNLYAGFIINKYTVTFDLREVADTSDPNAGDTYYHTVEVEYGQVASYTPAEVEGKTFSGWFTVDGQKYENTPIKQDTDLIGHWANIRYTITFDVNGGDSEIAPMTVDHGTIADIPVPERTGYAFLGWTCTSNTYYETSFPVTSDLSLKAEWKRNVFTVTFYIDNTVFKQIQVEYGQTLGNATSEVGIPKNIVVGFENVNTTTAAVAFSEFEVVDDVAVYLSEAPNIPDGSDKDKNTGKSVTNNIKRFFTDNWILLAVCAIACILFICLLSAAFKRKRR